VARRPRIGIVGTFDVRNYGDLLFPLLAAHELEQRLGPIDLVRYSYRALDTGSWAYEVRSVGHFGREVGELDLVLVGGGDVIRFDEHVAPGYVPNDPYIQHPTGYWLMPTLVAATAGVPVAWNAVGVVRAPSEREATLLVLATQVVDYLAVRDERSRDRLGEPSSPARVVPDTAFGLRALLGGDDASTSSRALLAEAGVEGSYVVVQPSPQLTPFVHEIAEAVSAVSAQAWSAVELPVSAALGDGPAALGLDDAVARFPEWPPPLVTAQIVAGAEAVIAQSLHLSITALTAGVPVFRRRSAPGSKYEVLETFPDVHVWDDAGELVAHVTGRAGRRPVSTGILERERALAAHWDAVAALVAGARPARPDVTLRLAALAAESAVSADRLEGELQLAARRSRDLEAERAQLHGSYREVLRTRTWRYSARLRRAAAAARSVLRRDRTS
jgi:lipopolysaccharide transport system ATP-binding protein